MVSIESVDGLPGFAEGVPGYELCPSVHMQAAEAGAQFAMNEVQHFDQDPEGWRVHTGAGTYCARAVIVATGTHFKALGLANEARLVGKGISHCASCDAPLLRDQDVVVVGGGDSALQEGLLLAQSASRVTVVHRGDALTGQAIYRDQVIAHPKNQHRIWHRGRRGIGNRNLDRLEDQRPDARGNPRSGCGRDVCLRGLRARNRFFAWPALARRPLA